MVQVIPKRIGFGEALGTNLGAGLGQGLALGAENLRQRKQLETLLNPPSRRSFSQELFNSSPSSPIDEIQEEPIKSRQPQIQAALAANRPDIARAFEEEEKLISKEKEAKASRHFEIAKDTLKSTAEKAEALPQKEAALQTMEEAIGSGNLGYFTKDNLAELFGIEGLRSPEGAVFKTAGKELFLGSIRRAGARPNQWIEQQISDMLPKLGRSTEANLSVTEALKTDIDIEKKQIELTNEIADEMERKTGRIGRDLSNRVMKKLTPYAIEKQKELKEKLMDIKDKYSPKTKDGVLMRDPSGALRRVPISEASKARKAGYIEAE